MTFKKGKQKFSQDEIIDILKRNVSLFRDEDEFVEYIVDLAMYLVEHRLMTATEADARAKSETPMPPTRAQQQNPAIEKRVERYTRNRERDEELYKALRKHVTRSDADTKCRMCGAPTAGRAICPNCGNMAF
jgi:rubrerythrin